MKRFINKIMNLPPTKKYVYYPLLAIFCAGAILIIILAAYAAKIYYIKNFGINLVPSENHAVQIAGYYRQNDPEWQDIKIGNSQRKMGSTGCLICCASTAISQLHSTVTPAELNVMITKVNGFQGADLIWNKINEIMPDLDYRYKRVFTGETIEKDLERGLLPIVNVRFHKTGAAHWVLIAGAENGEFIICDPMDDGHKTRLLSDHGKVYAYRVIEKAVN